MNEKPYTRDGSVNLAHLLVGSEGTLALTKNRRLQLAELPRAKVLGVVNFPTFYQGHGHGAAHREVGRRHVTAVELVDRTMLELSLKNPAFAPVVRTAVIGEPDAVLLVEFSAPTIALLPSWTGWSS